MIFPKWTTISSNKLMMLLWRHYVWLIKPIVDSMMTHLNCKLESIKWKNNILCNKCTVWQRWDSRRRIQGFSDQFGIGRIELGLVSPDWDWLIQIGTGRLVQDWFESEYCPSSEIPGQEKRSPNKYCCFIFSNIYINIGFYVHRNVVGNES